MSPCSIPVQIGHGMGQMKRVYYNAALGQCIPFIYSGMGGNENNFLTIQECNNKCLKGESNGFAYFDDSKFIDLSPREPIVQRLLACLITIIANYYHINFIISIRKINPQIAISQSYFV